MAAALACALTAQSFEVASIKASKAPDFRGLSRSYLPGGRLVTTNYPLLLLISDAYNVPPQSSRLKGVPEWAWSARFDIEAKAAEGAVPPGLPDAVRRERMRHMLQALMADRFHIAIHRETREEPVYALVVGKNGPKLTASAIEEKNCDEKCHSLRGGQGRGIHGRAIDAADLAQFLEDFADRPVIDRTGLSGLFDVDTTGWLPMRGKPGRLGGKAEDGSDMDTMPTMFTVVEGLGLKLESQKAPVETIVVDRVERPSEN
jgi:uncharacterized protein (TIGR03435 family)